MSRTPHEGGKPHALFLKFGDLLLVPVLEQSARSRAVAGFEGVLWALPGGRQATTATLREAARLRDVVFELITVGRQPQ